MTTAITIYPNGSIDISDQPADLPWLQKVVGGYIEAIYLNNTDHMYVNEDGLSLQLPVNLTATALWCALTGRPSVLRLRGTAVVLGTGADGEEADASLTTFDALTALVSARRRNRVRS